MTSTRLSIAMSGRKGLAAHDDLHGAGEGRSVSDVFGPFRIIKKGLTTSGLSTTSRRQLDERSTLKM